MTKKGRAIKISKRFEVSQRVKILRYEIRELVPLAKSIEKKGEKIFWLNIGDPLKYDFKTPEHIVEALYYASRENYNYYSDSQGLLELREAIVKKEKRVNNIDLSPDDIIITAGVSEGINFLMASLLEKNQELLIPSPTYPLYKNFIRFYGGEPKYYRLIENNNRWSIDLSSIEEKINDRTLGIVIINPNNPTGALFSKEDILKVGEIAKEHDLIIISDEIYDRIIYDKSFYSTASLIKDVPIVGLNGFSKTYLVTGWRLGYVYFSNFENDKLKDAFLKLARNRLCVSTPFQKALADTINKSDKHIFEMVYKLKRRRDFALKMIEENEDIECALPEGAFYLFPRIKVKGDWKNDTEFCRKLLIEEKVVIVSGSGFYMYDQNHFRTVFLPTEDYIQEAFTRIFKFIKRHKKESSK